MTISLFEAEKRGRTGDEDILTSKVFGTLSKINKNIVLHQLFKEIGIEISPKELEHSTIELWKDYNGTIPDVVFESKSYLVFIECKLNSPIDIKQLKREYDEGKKRGKDFYLISLTKDYSEPKEIKELREKLPNIKWTNWQQIKAICRNEIIESLDETSKELIKDLEDLLVSKGLRGFRGFKEEIVNDALKGTLALEQYFKEIVALIGQINNLLQENIEAKKQKSTPFKRDGTGMNLNHPGGWKPSFLTFAFGKKDWKFTSYAYSSYLFIRFYLASSEPECKMLIGYTIRTKGNNENIDKIYNKKSLICDQLKTDNKSLALITGQSEYFIKLFSGEDIKSNILTKEKLNDVYRVESCQIYTINDLFHNELVDQVINGLLYFYDFVNTIGLTPIELSTIGTEEQDINENT